MASAPIVAWASLPDYTAIRRATISQKNVKKKSKSKGHLVHRSAGIPPFSAWVEPVRVYEPLAAMQHARSEEARLKQVMNEREERLKEFQEGVKSRVKELERLRRQEQLEKTYKAVELERNVVQQSSFPRKTWLAKRDTCVYRDDTELTIKLPITRASVIHDHKSVDTANQLLEHHADKIRNSTRYARGVLKSKSMPVDEEQLQALPGGLWTISPTRDHATSRHNPRLDQRIEDHENVEKNGTAAPQTQEAKVDEQIEDYWMGPDEIRDMSITEDQEVIDIRESSELPPWLVGQDRVTIFHPGMDRGRRKKPGHRVQFSGVEVMGDGERDRCVPPGPSRIVRMKTVEDLIKPGKVVEEKKQQTKSQMAVYRRLFMDMEREQVRENIRMKEHRKRMAEIKVAKEIERLEVEHRQRALLEVQQSPEKQEMLLKAEQEDREYQRYLEQRHEKLQRSKESERYIDALRSMLREKLNNKGIRLPPLCACGPTIWDASPDTCANNCIFYKNPKAYARALSSLLGSLDS